MVSFFWESLEAGGERVALITERESVSYRDLVERIARVTDELRAILPEVLRRPLVLLEAVNELDAIVVNYQTGLVGSPISSRDALEFTALLNPALRPLGLVEVGSATGVAVQAGGEVLAATDLSGVLFGLEPGTFRISEVTHIGETRGQQWYSKVTCHPFVAVAPNA